VRSFAHELGLALGTYAHLTALRRLRAGEFTLGNAIELDALGALLAKGTLPLIRFRAR